MIKLRASKLTIKEVEIKEEREFLNNYHYQGYIPSTYCYGLYQDDELIELMSFGKPRYNKSCNWELLRLCSKEDYQVYGGASKLFNYFTNQFPNDVIISYCNRDKFDGKVYYSLNFEAGIITKGYHYEKDGISYNRSKFTKKNCLKLFPDVDPNLSERQIMELKGYTRIEDEVGQQVFFYYPTNKSPKWLIYKITINEYTYIGQHKYFNENDNYFGSGTILRRVQNKYNTKGIKEILVKDITSQQEANKLEKEFIDKDRKENPNNINIANGGYKCPGAKPQHISLSERIEKHNNWFYNLSEEEKKEYGDKISEGLNNYWSNAPEEVHNKCSNAAKEFWNNLSEEERKEFINKRAENYSNYYQNLSEEEKQNKRNKLKSAWTEEKKQLRSGKFKGVSKTEAHKEHISEAAKERWDNEEERNKQSERMKKYTSNLSEEERKQMTKKMTEAKQRKVRAIEDGIVFNSLKEAAEHYGLRSTSKIIIACKDPNKTSAKQHWEYV